ncbi:MAG: glutathione S-transferase family protein [Pleurocapsa sp.]
MLKFYYQKYSLYSRPVWITLLEKQLTFESIELSLNGDQWHPYFLAINPFGRVPVLIDNNFAIFESLAILDYLELQYPNPALLPTGARSITIARMIQLLAIHGLIPAMLTMIRATDNQAKMQRAKKQIIAMLSFLEQHLVTGNSYLTSDRISLADIVAGSLIVWLPYLKISLSNYSYVENWLNRLTQRSAWIATQPDAEDIPDWLKRIQKLPSVRERQWKQNQKY